MTARLRRSLALGLMRAADLLWVPLPEDRPRDPRPPRAIRSWSYWQARESAACGFVHAQLQDALVRQPRPKPLCEAHADALKTLAAEQAARMAQTLN